MSVIFFELDEVEILSEVAFLCLYAIYLKHSSNLIPAYIHILTGGMFTYLKTRIRMFLQKRFYPSANFVSILYMIVR